MKIYYFYLLLFFIFIGCKAKLTERQPSSDALQADTIKLVRGDDNKPSKELRNYKGSTPLYFKLIHTKLDLYPDFDKEKLAGSAEIAFHPMKNNSTFVQFDAKNMYIHKVEQKTNEGYKVKKYMYDSKKITVSLNNNKRVDTLTFRIHYEVKYKKSKTRSFYSLRHNGVYFVQPDEKHPFKTPQLWTQGEPENTSRWHPTFDSPNQKTSLEISLTVPYKFKTLSNGILQNTLLHTDSTRTDYWVQEKPHAPYLTMIAAGDFAIVEDYWRNTPLFYYVPKSYEKFAKQTFKNTREMLEFFSLKFGVDFPWDKYAQLIAENYFGGAMENTSATIFGDFMCVYPREHIDETHEEFISHELSHQWFGNLVTCESWDQLVLNEGFATYSEYLWIEHKYGKEKADYHLYELKQRYFAEHEYAGHPLEYHYFEDPFQMFDAHSYFKGAWVVHMLRKYLGDELFFKACQTYLNKYRFSTVEVDKLRMVCEDISGEDLNWFFNQWFNRTGYPVISFHEASNSDGKSVIHLRQNPKSTSDEPFTLPLKLRIFLEQGFLDTLVVFSKERDSINLSRLEKPVAIVPDPNGDLLVDIKWDKKNGTENIYSHSSNPVKQISILNHMAGTDQKISGKMYELALGHSFDQMRIAGIQGVFSSREYYEKLKQMALFDESPAVRTNAVFNIAGYPVDSIKDVLYKVLQKDSSLMVLSAVLHSTGNFPDSLRAGFAASRLWDTLLIDETCPVLASIGRVEDFHRIVQLYEKSGVKSRWGILDHIFQFYTPTFLTDQENSIPTLLKLFAEENNTLLVRKFSEQLKLLERQIRHIDKQDSINSDLSGFTTLIHQSILKKSNKL